MKFILFICCLTFLFQYSSCTNNNVKAPFGNILGVAQHTVVAYSNGDASYVSNETNSLYGIDLGLKWQAVEYARRYTLLRRGATFSDVNSASELWTSLTDVEGVLNNKKYSLKQNPNGSPTAPTVGSYLVYEVQNNLPLGHVAVVVGVTKNTVQVAEQNFYFNYWQEYYARQIPLVHRDGLFYVEDSYQIYGWLQIADEKHELKAVDQDIAAKIEAKNGLRSSSSSLSISSLAFVLFFSFRLMFN